MGFEEILSQEIEKLKKQDRPTKYYKSNGLYVEEITVSQIKNDAIDEFLTKLKDYIGSDWGYSEYQVMESIAERLKEKKNDN